MKHPHDHSSAHSRPELHLLTAVIVFCSILFTVLISGCSGNLSLNGTPFHNEQGEAYVNKMVPLIADTWNETVIIEQAHPELKKLLKDDKLHKLLQLCSTKLGSLKKVTKVQQTSIKSTFDASGQQTVIDYVVDADFEKGPGQIKMSVVQEGKNLSILSFYINSDAFLSHIKSAPLVAAGSSGI